MKNTVIDPSLSLQHPFISRHIGPDSEAISAMLTDLGFSDLEAFISSVVPQRLRAKVDAFDSKIDLDKDEFVSEEHVLEKLQTIADKNKVFKSYIGLGYYSCVVPNVIKRNILENPLWYTQYTPYQAEISQGRLEALLNFQTLITDLTGLPVANASLLDEATAAAEAMVMAYSQRVSAGKPESANIFHVSTGVFPQTLDLLKTRAAPLGIVLKVEENICSSLESNSFGVLIQYPAANGIISDLSVSLAKAKQQGCLVVAATDLLALMLLKSPAEIGADIAVGSSQRFGVPLGFGGPHAAFIACRDELKRLLPGRIIGISKDAQGRDALRLALQTREQHIRREKATSNICTAQVLLAVMASMYAVYHGPKGLRKIAESVCAKAHSLAKLISKQGLEVVAGEFFDTISLKVSNDKINEIKARAEALKINFGYEQTGHIRVSIDEATTKQDLEKIIEALTGGKHNLVFAADAMISASLLRQDQVLKQKVFNSYHSETELLRYINRLQSKDLSLAVSMIPLGSCTMKLNATSELVPVSWAQFSNIHPFVPEDQVIGYNQLVKELESWLERVTGFSATSLQPNSGAQGEYAGLLAIRNFHLSNGDSERKICLIPKSAHGTNAASAAMVGFEVVAISCDEKGNVEIDDVLKKCEQYDKSVAALMITYPSTHGVFEERIKEACDAVHKVGGQVYMDGANLNALVGLVRPIDLGADVCHSNLHKTFCIPHGGGGPGVGPVIVAEHLKNFLPGHAVVKIDGCEQNGAVSAAPWGSASILPISWVYMNLMGMEGLALASKVAILNANYIAKRLQEHYPILFVGESGFVAHECIIDLRGIEKTSGIKVEDVAKRLMDYGYHAPTISWPVPGTMMIEPTESESKAELDRFCEAMISIRNEIALVESGKLPRDDNPLKNAPHTAAMLIADEWTHAYSRNTAAYPASWTKEFKFWPAVARIDNVYGDRNFFCSCQE
jgi:glycine dehydrogenase